MNRRGFLTIVARLFGAGIVAPTIPPAIKSAQQNCPEAIVSSAVLTRKEEWQKLDALILKSASYRLRSWANLCEPNKYLKKMSRDIDPLEGKSC